MCSATRISENAPKVSGASGASAPPASMTVARPSPIRRAASPIAIMPAAHELPYARQGPFKPNSIEIFEEAAPPKTESASNGLTPCVPDWTYAACCSSP